MYSMLGSNAAIANLEETQRLLETLICVGKKRRSGWGAVQRFEAAPTESFEMTRPKPSDSGVFQSWTNPHWDDRLWRYCA